MSHVLVRCAHRGGRAAAKRLRGRAREFLDALGLDEAELSLSIVGDAEIRELNRSWRGKDSATDVLSFPLSATGAGPMLGDVVISLETAARVAREDRRDLDAELDRYLAHGILHLTGHDHVSARQARDMAAAEERLLSAAGMVAAALAPAPARRSASRGAGVQRAGGTGAGVQRSGGTGAGVQRGGGTGAGVQRAGGTGAGMQRGGGRKAARASAGRTATGASRRTAARGSGRPAR